MDRRVVWLVILCFAGIAFAQNSTDSPDDRSFSHDPMLQYRPEFSRSLPIQILATGVTFTLTAALLIHLVFTIQYHWPLAPVNFALQLTGVVTLLVSLIATIKVIMESAINESRQWPYMLSYVAVDTPPLTQQEQDESDWTMNERAAWLLMAAANSGLIQITHIQLLTILYPSTLERRMIFCLLGPLAILSAAMQLIAIDSGLADVADVVHNVCNATLSLIFTAALLIWGLLVNRAHAWRTDGGTAAFGAGSCLLALIATALTFVYIPSKDQYSWMPGLILSIILWQSFLGWWWWVGAGVGGGAIEERLLMAEKRKDRRRAREAKRQERQDRARDIWKGVTNVFVAPKNTDQPADTASVAVASGRELHSGSPASLSGVRHSGEGEQPRLSSPHTQQSGRTSVPASRTTTMSDATVPTRFGGIAGGVQRLVHSWYVRLRQAHRTAARRQAVEHVERIHQLYGTADEDETSAGGAYDSGWRLGQFTARNRERSDEETDGDAAAAEEGSGAHGNDVPSGKDEDKQLPSKIPKDQPDRRSPESTPPSSLWWWGPLRRCRLQDSTHY